VVASTLKCLVRAVRSSPGDLAPRAALADFLQDNPGQIAEAIILLTKPFRPPWQPPAGVPWPEEDCDYDDLMGPAYSDCPDCSGCGARGDRPCQNCNGTGMQF
jgi:hypothetical protein